MSSTNRWTPPGNHPTTPTPQIEATSAGEALPMRAPRGRSSSGKRAERLGLVIGVAILEVLPISIGLQAWEAIAGGSPQDALVPLWLLLLTILGAYWFGTSLRRQSPGGAISASVPFLVAMIAIGLSVSPTAYGNVPGGPFSILGALGADLLHGAGRLNAVFWMTALLCYVWWRGMRAGRNNFTLDGLLMLFKYSIAVAVAGVIL